jgi:arylformamidase
MSGRAPILPQPQRQGGALRPWLGMTGPAGYQREMAQDAWRTLSQEARDLAYNNNAAVAESARLNAERIAASARFRAATPAVLDVPYGPAGRMRWDLFPAADRWAPCFVFIHGGYWQRNRREDFCSLVEGVRAHGWSAALPGHSLAPEKPLAGIVAEISAALDWLAANGAGYGIAGPILLSGWSAGGHLAALGLGHKSVAAGLAISGIFDLTPIRDTYLNEKLRLTGEEIASLSPLRLPPVQKTLAIAYGTAELPRLVADSRAFHAHRTNAGAPGPLVPVAEANHFTILDALSSPDGLLTQTALSLMRA